MDYSSNTSPDTVELLPKIPKLVGFGNIVQLQRNKKESRARRCAQLRRAVRKHKQYSEQQLLEDQIGSDQQEHDESPIQIPENQGEIQNFKIQIHPYWDPEIIYSDLEVSSSNSQESNHSDGEKQSIRYRFPRFSP